MSCPVGSQKRDQGIQGQVPLSRTWLHVILACTCPVHPPANWSGWGGGDFFRTPLLVWLRLDQVAIADLDKKNIWKKTSMTCTEGLFAVLVDSTCFVQDYLIDEVTYISLCSYSVPFSSCAIVPSQPRIEKPVFEVTRATGS